MRKSGLSSKDIRRLERRYETLRLKLCAVEGLSQGSVMGQPSGAWRWTRKVAGKTVSRGLSKEQATLMARAIANQRALDGIIDEMRTITQNLILEASVPPRLTKPENLPNPP